MKLDSESFEMSGHACSNDNWFKNCVHLKNAEKHVNLQAALKFAVFLGIFRYHSKKYFSLKFCFSDFRYKLPCKFYLKERSIFGIC